MGKEVEITSVTIAGREIDADKLICQPCMALYLDTVVDTTDPVLWKATCPSCAHQWEFVW